MTKEDDFLKVDVIPSEDKEDKKAKKLNPKVIMPPFCFLLCGSPGTGKSSLIWTMASKWYQPYKWDLIVIWNGAMDANHAFEKLQTEKTKLVIKNSWDNEQFTAFLETVEKTNDELEKEGKRKRRILLIFDDMVTYQLWKPANVTRFDTMIQNRRHLGISCIISTQSYKQCNRSIRALNLSALFLTQINGEEAEQIANEHQSPLYGKKEVLSMIGKYMHSIKPGQFNFMIIDYKRPPHDRYWIGLHEQKLEP